MKAILLIGVGEIGLNQIKWAREAGFFVIAADRDPAAPALELADHGINISGTDTRALVAWALENRDNYNLQAVYSGNDLGVFSASAVAQALDLDFLSLASAARGLSKSLMKECWAADGVPSPEYEYAESVDHAKEIITRFGWPVIIKPMDSSGSQGIQILENLESLDQAWQEAEKFTNSNRIIIENHVDGRHIDGNAFFWNGEFFPCGLSERIFSPAPYRVPIGGYEPVFFSAEERGRIVEAFEKAARSLGLGHGPVKGDFILTEQGIQIIEVSPRFHGDVGTSHITNYRTGSSHLRVYFEALASGEVPREELAQILNTEKICGWQVFDLPPGDVTNLDEAAKAAQEQVAQESAEVANVFVRPRGPRQLTNLRNNNHVAGFVWAVGDSRQEIDDKLNHFQATLKNKVVFKEAR